MSTTERWRKRLAPNGGLSGFFGGFGSGGAAGGGGGGGAAECTLDELPADDGAEPILSARALASVLVVSSPAKLFRVVHHANVAVRRGPSREATLCAFRSPGTEVVATDEAVVVANSKSGGRFEERWIKLASAESVAATGDAKSRRAAEASEHDYGGSPSLGSSRAEEAEPREEWMLLHGASVGLGALLAEVSLSTDGDEETAVAPPPKLWPATWSGRLEVPERQEELKACCDIAADDSDVEMF